MLYLGLVPTADATKRHFPMSFYVYRATERVFLADDEKAWTECMFSAAAFTSRQLAEQIAERELGPGHDAYVLDDGVDD